MKARKETVTNKVQKRTVHTNDVPMTEAEICLTCPLKECNKTGCERFRKEKQKLKK